MVKPNPVLFSLTQPHAFVVEIKETINSVWFVSAVVTCLINATNPHNLWWCCSVSSVSIIFQKKMHKYGQNEQDRRLSPSPYPYPMLGINQPSETAPGQFDTVAKLWQVHPTHSYSEGVENHSLVRDFQCQTPIKKTILSHRYDTLLVSVNLQWRLTAPGGNAAGQQHWLRGQ